MYILQKILEKCKNILKKDRKLQKIYKEGLKITAMIAILFENLFKPRQRRLTVLKYSLWLAS